MKIFSYIWLFPTWLFLTIITGPKNVGKFDNFIKEAEYIHYSLATILNLCFICLGICIYNLITIIK